MLHYLCQELTRQECDTLKFMCERDIPRARLESIQGPQDFFRVLESQHKLSADRMDYLLHRLRHLNRQDLVRKAEQFRNTHQSAHLSTVDDVYSENIAVSLKPAATHDYRKDDADLEENFAPRDVLVRQHQQLRRQTDCQIEDNRTTVDERTIHLTSRQMETGLLLNRESYGDLRQSVGINEEVFNTGRRNGVQGSRNHDADMPCYSMRRKPRGDYNFRELIWILERVNGIMLKLRLRVCMYVCARAGGRAFTDMAMGPNFVTNPTQLINSSTQPIKIQKFPTQPVAVSQR
jgi:hypothetical protein